MKVVFTIFLVLHIIGGTFSLLSGLGAVISKKGSLWHRRFGKVFFYAMLLTTLSALVMAALKTGLFLFTIAVFSFYQTYMGYRAIKNKSMLANRYDKIIWGVALINAVVMITTLHPVLMVFGGIGLANTIRQLMHQRKLDGRPAPKGDWLQLHIGMMMGAFIATITAFVVVNAPDNLGTALSTLLWLAPTIVLVPLLVYWSIKHKKKGT